MTPDVSIIVVSYNDAADLPVSVGSALAQKGVSVEVVVVDNDSGDDSAALAKGLGARVIELAENVGFAAAMNAGITRTVDATCSRSIPTAGLRRTSRPSSPRVWTRARTWAPRAGVFFARTGPSFVRPGSSIRGDFLHGRGTHFDRGSGEPADGRFLEEEEVAGASGAAGFYRREALETSKISTGYFDADFFLYREDADLAWRLSRLGWKCLYVPSAVAAHRRRNLPERRSAMPALINLHSVKNRFLLRINNQTGTEALRTFLPTAARDLVVLGACLTVERTSLPAFSWLWRNRYRLWAKRKEIQSKHRHLQPADS